MSDLEKEVDRQYQLLKFGTFEITPEDEFKSMLRKSIETKTPLRVKYGIDPTATDVHIGHLVPCRKMRQFQDLGHIGVLIIGDYTASIGDPTGKNESRQSLELAAVKKNAETYLEQLYTVLDRKKTEVHYQSEWFNDVSLSDVIGWAANTTVAKLLGHETFRERLDSGASLSLHELFYPVLQGIDSVYIKADVELGGSDQRFNVLMGRDYQRAREQRPQSAVLLPMLLGTCGKQKMSKSLGNYIGIFDEPFDKFGKVMSIPDDMMENYYKYAIAIPELTFNQLMEGYKSGKVHPNDFKKDLAERVVSIFHGEASGKEMRTQFENVFKKKNIPDDIPEYKFERGDSLVSVLQSSGLLASKGEGRRLVKQNAVGLMDGDKLTDADLPLDEQFAGKVIKVGKRKFLKLV